MSPFGDLMGFRHLHSIEPKGALTPAGLAVGYDVGVFAALFNGKRGDPVRFIFSLTMRTG
jgi:hypothetical protein